MLDKTPSLKRVLSIEDIAVISSVSEARISPDGSIVACVVTSTKNNSYHNNIILIDISSGQKRVLTAGSSPQWSHDGKEIAYIGDNNGTQAIFICNLKNDSNEFLANIYESDYFIDHYANINFCWSPDGSSIAYVSTEPYVAGSENHAFREFTDLLYKTKGGRGRQIYADKRHLQIWLVDVRNKKTRPVFASEYNAHSISWSPDGKRICFISNITGNPDRNQWSDVFSVDILTGELNKISREKGSSFQPVWSPDGQFIAYLGITGEISTNDSPAEDTQLYIVPSQSGPSKCMTLSLDRRIEQVSWDPSSRYIYFTSGNKGNTFLYRVSLISGIIETVIDIQGKVAEYFISNDGKKIIYVHTDTIHLTDIFIYDIRNFSHLRLTDIREELLDKYILQPAETYWFKSFDETDVQGWIIRPAHFNENKKYPLVLVIHGGPHNMFGYEFEDRMQLLAAHGYALLFINPRGSSGYGQKFSYGNVLDWGGGDYKDLMSGLDFIIDKYDWIDKEKLGVTGQSYGGYMTNWIITQTNRFKAAVVDGGLSNLISFSGTSLYHSLMESEFKGNVYDNFNLLWQCSPLRNVMNATTPTLFLHGETDNEVPFSQAEEMFMGVKKAGAKTMLVQYTGEGHGWRPDLKPENRSDLYQRMISWFDQHFNEVKDP